MANLPYNSQYKEASPIRKNAKYPKSHLSSGMDSYGPPTSLRDTIAKFGKNTRVD